MANIIWAINSETHCLTSYQTGYSLHSQTILLS